jgi:ACS family tartrate transporter-like MFS transporter
MQKNQAIRKPESSGLAVVPPLTEEAIGRSALRKASVRLLPMIGVGYGIAYMDRVNVSFAALQMNKQLHFSATIFGLGAGLFFLSYAACEIPSNLLLVRFGARRWLARIMLTWGLLSMAMIFVRTPGEFYVMRLLLGIAEAGFFPGVIFYLTQWFPAGERSKAVSRFYIAYPLASTVMGGLAGWLLHLDGRGGLAGWQWLLLLEGVPALLMSVVFFLGLPDGPAKAAWLTDAERAWIVRKLEDEPGEAAHGSHGVGRAFRDPRVWLLGGLYFCVLLANYGYTFSAPALVQQVTGLSTTGVGMIIAVLGVLGALAMLVNGTHSSRTGERYRHVLAPLFIMALGYAIAGSSVRPVVVLPALVLMMMGFTAIMGPLWAIPPEFLRGRSAAAGIATINMIAIVGGFVGPYWMGISIDRTGGFQRGLLTMAVPVVAAAGLMTAIHRYGERRARAMILASIPENAPVADTGV